jgi:hypothetical protein
LGTNSVLLSQKKLCYQNSVLALSNLATLLFGNGRSMNVTLTSNVSLRNIPIAADREMPAWQLITQVQSDLVFGALK